MDKFHRQIKHIKYLRSTNTKVNKHLEPGINDEKDVAAWTFECDSKLTLLLLCNENQCFCMNEDYITLKILHKYVWCTYMYVYVIMSSYRVDWIMRI